MIYQHEDKYRDSKDGCLFHKTHTVIEQYNIGTFCWASDDNLLCKPMNLADIPVIHNHRTNERYYSPGATKWQSRVRQTLEWARERGVGLPHAFECHCPQIFDGQALLEGMKGVPYYPEIPHGKTIYTTWRVVTDTWRQSENQLKWKESYELPCTAKDLRMELPLLGYNDAGFEGIREELFRRFPERSRFEK